jgi:hypothetical protein
MGARISLTTVVGIGVLRISRIAARLTPTAESASRFIACSYFLAVHPN